MGDMKILENVPLSGLTTMRLGGPARYVVEVESPDEVAKAYDFAREKNLPTFVLGGGANTIARDAGFNGVIIKNTMSGIEMDEASDESSGVLVKIMGGTDWDEAVAFTTERGLTGIEALSKIPGLSGAAPVQNIGAYGQDISQVFVSAEVYDSLQNEFRTLEKADFGFSYRKSILNTREVGRYFVIAITLRLTHGVMARPFYNSVERYIEANGISDLSPQSLREIVSAIRADKLPDPRVKASAGSFFKNIYRSETEAKEAEAKGYPVYRGHDGLKINSGWLIEECGLKGALIHGMRVNPKAALVLINESAAGYDDLAAARSEIIEAVREKFGYTLEQEPVEI